MSWSNGLLFLCLVAGPAQAQRSEDRYRAEREEMDLLDLTHPGSDDQRLTGLGKVRSEAYRSERVVREVARTARAGTTKRQEVARSAVETLAVIATPLALESLAALCVEFEEEGDRQFATTTLSRVLFEHPSQELATLYDGVLSQPQAAAWARKALTTGIGSFPPCLEELAALEPGSVQKAAAAEVARYRRLDPSLPLADIRALEGWKQAKLRELDEAIANNRRSMEVQSRLRSTRRPRHPGRWRAQERRHGARPGGRTGAPGRALGRHGPAAARSEGAPPAWAEGVVSRAEEAPGPSHQGSGVVVRGKFRPARGLVAKVKREAPVPPGRHRRTRGERLARQLALAHWIERAVEAGHVASYGEVARILGLTESRVTQVTALLGLSPEVQERILLGEGGIWIREAIRVGREAEWERQTA